jgi:hypothetical protein
VADVVSVVGFGEVEKEMKTETSGILHGRYRELEFSSGDEKACKQSTRKEHDTKWV